MHRERKFLVPNKGYRVRKESDPKSFVKPKGELLPYSIYYRRRVKWGELTIKEEKKSKK